MGQELSDGLCTVALGKKLAVPTSSIIEFVKFENGLNYVNIETPQGERLSIRRVEGKKTLFVTKPKRHQPTIDPIYLHLADGVPHGGTREFVEGVLFGDCDSDGNLLGLEILGPVTAEQLTCALKSA